jgi:hypothetical protein
VQLEGSGKLKKFNDHIGAQTHDLPACSIAPQPSTLPRPAYVIETTERGSRFSLFNTAYLQLQDLTQFYFGQNMQ